MPWATGDSYPDNTTSPAPFSAADNYGLWDQYGNERVYLTDELKLFPKN